MKKLLLKLLKDCNKDSSFVLTDSGYGINKDMMNPIMI